MVGRTITESEEEKIVNFGALNYDVQKMSSILGWEEDLVDDLMKDKNSDFYRLYKRGRDVAEYLIDKKLLDMAKSGDMKAIHRYEQRLRKRLR